MSQVQEMSYSEAIEKAGGLLVRFPLIPVKGVPLMSIIANNWDSIWAFRPDPTDLLIATYPKAGTETDAFLFSFLGCKVEDQAGLESICRKYSIYSN